MIEPYELLSAEVEGDHVFLTAYCYVEHQASLAGSSPDDYIYHAVCTGVVDRELYEHPRFDYSLDCDNWEEGD